MCPAQQIFAIVHPSDIAMTRRCGTQLATEMGFDETTAGRLALVITEAATNILKHAGEGCILLAPRPGVTSGMIEVLALDKGPGMTDMGNSLRDGISTTGTSGTGLGAMKRQANHFDAYTQPGRGTGIYMAVHPPTYQPPAHPVEYGVVCLPMPHQEVCGDGWATDMQDQRALFLVADGLGHGPEAARASRAAQAALTDHSASTPKQIVEMAHARLRDTRGAALAVASLDYESRQIAFAGVGNISVSLRGGPGTDTPMRKHLVSHNGIVGHNVRRIQEFPFSWEPGQLCVMHSDGLGTQWDLENYPALNACHPTLIAGILYRDFNRGRDDVTILVARH